MLIDTKPDFIKMEHDILAFWEEQKCFEQLRGKNKDGRRFRFLDGPITANNPMGIHHAWGRSIKDIVLRYKAMNGYSCHYRNGFDTQGLWVEVEVEKELGFKDKRDIEAYGMDNFTNKCIERIKRFSGVITEQSKRLGQWMDWDNSYFTHTDENISAIWHFLKICHQNGWITKAYRPMPWCPRCGTSLSEHEMAGSHKDITHTAVFAIAPVKNADFDMLVWTTTPWTLSANTALAVNKDLDYAVVKCEGFDKPLVMAKVAIKHIKDVKGEMKVLRIVKGSSLIGLEYETFFPELNEQKELINEQKELLNKKTAAHIVIPWDEVDAGEGSGVVHIAPGCGAEDYELGKKFSLAELCPIDEAGVFISGYGFLEGMNAKDAAPAVFEKLNEYGRLFHTHIYNHSYPVCWRCKTEVLFRLVQEWYIKTEEVKPRLIKAADTVKWEPSFIGKRMNDWLNNMGDWNISRKRFYGLPLPFYPCGACGQLTVAGGRDDLNKLSGGAADLCTELHRPWIDDIKIKCPCCGEMVSRIEEVGDVWLDAGIVPYSTLGYFTDKEEWERNFPAEWVIEMQEQVRLWFYSQLFMSVVITGRAPYERVQTNNWVLAEDGTKFSKTGFMIRFDEAAEKMGSDAIRYLFAGASMSSDVRFGYSMLEEARRKLLGFWNIYSFFMTYAGIDKPSVKDILSADIADAYQASKEMSAGHKASKEMSDGHPVSKDSAGGCKISEDLMDRWLYARISTFVNKAVKSMEAYHTTELIREFEACIDDVSNWYIRASRRRFWKDGIDEDKQNAYNSLFYAVKTIAQVMSPVLPFMTEHIWQNMVRVYGTGEESIHLSSYPRRFIVDEALLNQVDEVRSIIAGALRLRNNNNIKVKQPLSALYLGSGLKDSCLGYLEIIKYELNVHEIIFLSDFDALSDEYLSLNFKEAGRYLKGDLNYVKGICETLTDLETAELVKVYKQGNILVLKGYDKELPKELFMLMAKDKDYISKLNDTLLIAINIEITPELKSEGMYREVLRSCQLLRKEAGFAVSDRVKLAFITESPAVKGMLEIYMKAIEREALSEIVHIEKPVMQKMVKMDGEEVVISIS